jgi:hypothetical protein
VTDQRITKDRPVLLLKGSISHFVQVQQLTDIYASTIESKVQDRSLRI